MTGQEHHDIQQTIVSMIAHVVPPNFLHAIHALINFMYQSQSPIQTDSSIAKMESSLKEFHEHKSVISDAGARRTAKGPKDDFFIPKLELLLSFASAVRNNGGLIQYTANVSECLLITHCKNTFG